MSDYLKSFTDGETILADETNSNNQYLLNQITSSINTFRNEIQQILSGYIGNFVKPGFIIAISHNSIPTGYLKCDGSSLLRTDFADLFNVIGTIYGYSDNYHFNLPNFQGAFLRGYGGNSASIGSFQGGGVPNITGNLYQAVGKVNSSMSADGAFSVSYLHNDQYEAGGHRLPVYNIIFNASRSSSIYKDGLNEVRPNNYAVNWIIKY